MQNHKWTPKEEEVILFYKRVNNGEISRFPNGFWIGEEGKERARILTKFMIEDLMKLPENEIPFTISKKIFRKYGLYSVINLVCKNKTFNAIDLAYRGRFNEYQFRTGLLKKKVNTDGALNRHLIESRMKKFDNIESIKSKLKSVIEDEYRIPKSQIPSKLTKALCKKLGIRSLIETYFENSLYKAIDSIYPGDFKPSDFPDSNKERGEEKIITNATREELIAVSKLKKEDRARFFLLKVKDLIENVEKMPHEDLPILFTKQFLRKHGFESVIRRYFNGSPYRIIEALFPGDFEPWQFTQFGMWTKDKNGYELAAQATKAIIEKKLKIKLVDIPRKVAVKTFIENGLYGMLNMAFYGSPYLAIENAYPGVFTKSQFIDEQTKQFRYYTNVGHNTQKSFVDYIKKYCEKNGLGFQYEKKAGTGRIEILCSSEKVYAIDITRSTTKRTIEDKWLKRDYHTDKKLDEIWIVVNSDSFNELDYLRFNKKCPENVRVMHITEVFNMLGKPSRELKLKLEAYSICRYLSIEKVQKMYRDALESGRDTLIPVSNKANLQKKLMDFGIN